MTLLTSTSNLNEVNVIRFFHMTKEIAVPFIVNPKSESVNTYYLNITNIWLQKRVGPEL